MEHELLVRPDQLRAVADELKRASNSVKNQLENVEGAVNRLPHEAFAGQRAQYFYAAYKKQTPGMVRSVLLLDAFGKQLVAIAARMETADQVESSREAQALGELVGDGLNVLDGLRKILTSDLFMKLIEELDLKKLTRVFDVIDQVAPFLDIGITYVQHRDEEPGLIRGLGIASMSTLLEMGIEAIVIAEVPVGAIALVVNDLVQLGGDAVEFGSDIAASVWDITPQMENSLRSNTDRFGETIDKLDVGEIIYDLGRLGWDFTGQPIVNSIEDVIAEPSIENISKAALTVLGTGTPLSPLITLSNERNVDYIEQDFLNLGETVYDFGTGLIQAPDAVFDQVVTLGGAKVQDITARLPISDAAKDNVNDAVQELTDHVQNTPLIQEAFEFFYAFNGFSSRNR